MLLVVVEAVGDLLRPRLLRLAMRATAQNCFQQRQASRVKKLRPKIAHMFGWTPTVVGRRSAIHSDLPFRLR